MIDAPAWRRAAFAAAVLANLVLLYFPRAVNGGGVPHLDKVTHVLAFAVVAWTGLRAGVPARWLLPVLAVHAVLSEVVQAVVLDSRRGDVADAVADLLGVLAGTLAARASWRDAREPAGRRR